MNYKEQRDNLIKNYENNNFQEKGFHSDILNPSSVVLGYGYDLNQQTYTQIIADFTEAGILGDENNVVNEESFKSLIFQFKNKNKVASDVIDDLNEMFLNSQIPTWSKVYADELYNIVIQRYETGLQNYFASKLDSNPNYANSSLYQKLLTNDREFHACVSLYYNCGTQLFGSGFWAAIEQDNRALLWYEIRYNSNGGTSASKGIANRRNGESDLFGLFNDVNDKECRDAYIMYQDKKDIINGYEQKYAAVFNSSNSIQTQLSPATEYLNNVYSLPLGGKRYNWNEIIVIKEGTKGGQNFGYQEDGHLIIGQKTAQNDIIGTVFNDVIYGGDESDVLEGGQGDDILSGGGAQDILWGGEGKDSLHGGIGNDTLYGEEGDDTLFGDDGNDILEGGAGNDVLYGGTGDDILNGGEGDDYLFGGSGNDIYKLSQGKDHISDEAGNYDVVELSGDFKYVTHKNKLIFFDTKTGSRTFVDQGKIEAVKIGDTYINNPTIQEGVGHATSNYTTEDGVRDIYGEDAHVTVLRKHAWADFITFQVSYPTFYGNNFTFSFEGLTAEEASNVRMTCVNAEKNIWEITCSWYSPAYEGEVSRRLALIKGNSDVSGTEEDETQISSCPVTQISGLEGNNNIYFFGFGECNREISDIYGAEDIIVLSKKISRTDVTFLREGANLIISLSDGSKMTVKNGALYDSSSFIEKVRFNNGIDADINLIDIVPELEYHGTDGNDNMQGGSRGDRIFGGAGDDKILGGGGNDIIFGGDGNDRIFVEGGDNYLYGDAGDDHIEGSWGNDHIYGGEGNDTLYGYDGDDYLDGGAGDDILQKWGRGNDTFRFGFGYGNDLVDTQAYSGQETIELSPEVRASDVTFSRDNGDLLITLSDGSTMRIYKGLDFRSNFFVEKVHFTNGLDEDIDLKELVPVMPVYGTDGNDNLSGDEYNNTYYGGKGDDYLYGDRGNDFLFGEDDNDTIKGGDGDDYLDGGAGNDVMDGGNGNDTYRFGFGYGSDVIREGKTGQGLDTIEMAPDVRASDLTFSRSGIVNILITLTDGSTLLIENMGNTDQNYLNSAVETIHFTNGIDNDINLLEYVEKMPLYGTENGESLTAHENLPMTIYGEGGNDTLNGGQKDDRLYGGEGNDILYGKDGNDFLDGGAGNDLLSGWSGDDIYQFGVDYGMDTIEEYRGNDTLRIADVGYDLLWFSREGNNLKVSINGTNDSITIKNWFYSSDCVVETIETDTHTLSHTDVNQLVQAMAGFNPPSGSIAQDATLSSALDDTLQQTWYAKTAA